MRLAKDILIKGGYIVIVACMKDLTLRLLYKNRRRLTLPNGLMISYFLDNSNILLDKEPLNDINHCKTLRFL
jgi:hypothetical protein